MRGAGSPVKISPRSGTRGRDRTGTGLGLSIVKEIITAHGQTISVVSTENVGTEFVFSLEAVL